MLVYLEDPDAAGTIMAVMLKAPSQEEQLDYARFLRVLKSGWTPALRKPYFEWFLKAANFRGGSSLAGFLRDIKADAVATLSADEKEQLASILNAKPEKKKVLENLLAGRSVVKEWKVDDLAPALARSLKGRNYEHGRAMLGAVGCYNCHRFAGEGGAVGPDLTGVSGRFSPRDLLESIVEPNKEVSDQYGQIIVEKKDGDLVVGRVANLHEETINIMTDMFDPNGFTNVKRADIASIRPSTVSPMPEGLLNTLKEDEILDLAAFLLSGGDPKSKFFK